MKNEEMSVSDRLKNICAQKNISIRDLAESIGVSHTGLYASIRKNSFNTQVLEKIAKSLGVHISVFFGANPDQEKHAKEFEARYNMLIDSIDKLLKQYGSFEGSLTGAEKARISDNPKFLIFKTNVYEFLTSILIKTLAYSSPKDKERLKFFTEIIDAGDYIDFDVFTRKEHHDDFIDVVDVDFETQKQSKSKGMARKDIESKQKDGIKKQK